MWRYSGQPDPMYTDTLELDMGTVEPSLAGPKRPQDRIALSVSRRDLSQAPRGTMTADRDSGGSAEIELDGKPVTLEDGAVLIAAITSCTNTSNPAVMIAAGLLARNAREKGLTHEAVGQDQSRPGIEGGYGLPREVGPE